MIAMLGWMLLPKREKAEIGMLKIVYRCERALEQIDIARQADFEPMVKSQREIDDLFEIRLACREYLKSLEIGPHKAQEAINYGAKVADFVNLYYTGLIAGKMAFARTFGAR